MSLEGIVSISSYGGLFKVISSTKNGIIVESLEDKKRIQAFAHFKISALSEISIYTNTDNAPLSDVLNNIYEKEKKGKTSIDPKADPKELKNYFKSVLPEYDEERVYVSDIKKVITWYNTLHTHNMLPVETETTAKEETKSAETSIEVETQEKEAKPKKSSGRKKASTKKSETSESEA